MTFVDDFHFLIAFILLEFIRSSFGSITNSKYFIFCLWNSHFSDFSRKFLRFKHFRILLTCFTYFFIVLKYIKILLKYATTKWSKYFFNASLTIFWHIAGAFVNSKKYYIILIMFVLCLKNCFSFFAFFYSNQIINFSLI